jgi:putative pyruvate formate lyase activating enzyme
MGIENKIKIIDKSIDFLYKKLEKCDFCPRVCKVNRLKGEKGYCGMDKNLVIYTAFIHNGEEPVISGRNGSGTIFFSGCNLKCVYCQNHRFSHDLEGKIIKEEELARIMLVLQEKAAHNINLVTPTHFLPQILKSLLIALQKGLNIPIVYNTSGYEKEDIIETIGKIIDIYVPDMKYINPVLSKKYSNAENYPLFNQNSIKEMYKQKKILWKDNLLKEGLIIRHLVLPNYPKETIKFLAWLQENTPQAILSLMFQYQPYFKANVYSEINRKINIIEYEKIKESLKSMDLEGWIQGLNPKEELAGVYFNPSIENLIEQPPK